MNADSFTLVATGDAILGHPVADLAGTDQRFDDLLSVLDAADAALTQLEPVVVGSESRHASLSQVSDQYQSLAPFPGAIMGMPPERLDDLSTMGLDLITAASNHAYDFGPAGVRQTLAATRERGLTVAGIGPDRSTARSPAYRQTDGGRVGVVDATTSVPPGGAAGVSTAAFDGQAGVSPLHVEWTYRVPEAQLARLREVAATAGIEDVKGKWLRRTNPDWSDDAFYFMQMRFRPATAERPPGIYQTIDRRDRAALLSQVREADAQADWTVLGLHAHQSADGSRNTSATPPFLRQLARDAVDDGADAVVVTGPHTLRGIEVYRGRPICYSLGNFCFHEENIYRIPDTPERPTDASPMSEGTALARTRTRTSTTTRTTGGQCSPPAGSVPTVDSKNWCSIPVRPGRPPTRRGEGRRRSRPGPLRPTSWRRSSGARRRSGRPSSAPATLVRSCSERRRRTPATGG